MDQGRRERASQKGPWKGLPKEGKENGVVNNMELCFDLATEHSAIGPPSAGLFA